MGGLGTARLQTPASRAECSDGVRGRSVLRQASKGALELCSVDPVRGGLSQGPASSGKKAALFSIAVSGAEEAGSKVLSGAALLL